MDKLWGRRIVADGQSDFDALQSWWYGTETPAQLERGDMVVDDNFGEHVVCVCIDETNEVYMDVTQIRPSMQRYFLFYSRAAQDENMLHVWGGLTVDMLLPLLYSNKGVVQRDRDLLWQSPAQTQCRALLRRPQGPTMGTDHYFFFPLFGAEFQDVLENAYPITGEVYDVFLKRLESYTVPIEHSAVFPAGTTIQQSLLDKGSFLLAANLTRELYPPEVALTYEKVRMERERILYWNRWIPFLTTARGNEMALLGLLKYNAGLWQWLMQRVVVATPEDEQAWWRTRTVVTDEMVPAVWFAIPCAQIPWTLRDMRVQFPVHPGGLIHVPAEAHWIAPWIWDALVVPEAQRHFAAPPIPKQSSLLHRLGLLEEAKSWAGRAQSVRVRQSHSGTVVNAVVPALDDGGGMDIEEMDRIWSVLPPCLRRVREQQHFPVNAERVDMVEIMRLGGLSMETMIYFFEKLNKHRPKNKPETLTKRFKLEATLNAWKNKPEHEQQIWCTTYVNNALDKGGNAGVLACPFALENATGTKIPHAERPVFTGRCREQCVATSDCAGPRRKPHWKPWATPSSALQEALEKSNN